MEAHFRRSLRWASELGMRPLQARCRLGLGRLRRQAGRAADARSELGRAVALFRSLAMEFWLAQAEADPARRAPS